MAYLNLFDKNVLVILSPSLSPSSESIIALLMDLIGRFIDLLSHPGTEFPIYSYCQSNFKRPVFIVVHMFLLLWAGFPLH